MSLSSRFRNLTSGMCVWDSAVAPHLRHRGNLAAAADFVARKKIERDIEWRREDMATGAFFLTSSDNTHTYTHTPTHTEISILQTQTITHTNILDGKPGHNGIVMCVLACVCVCSVFMCGRGHVHTTFYFRTRWRREMCVMMDGRHTHTHR